MKASKAAPVMERVEQGGVQAVPPTLQQSLTARLDCLGSAREVAQIGAVIGRNFSYPLLRAVAAIEEAPLQAALEKLADADILLVQGWPPTADYRFKHALTQDAAYENLLKSRRLLGTARRNEHGAALARSGQARV
jgi:predicted ATPase